jgi:integrase/recombinase XerC/integrase/recombinase XerD
VTKTHLPIDVSACLSVSCLEEQAADWIEDGKLRRHSAQTQSARVLATGMLLDFLRERECRECGVRELRAFLADLSTRDGGALRPGSIATYYSRLRTFFRWMVEYEVIPASPLDRLKPPRVPKDQVQPFTDEHCRALYAAAGRGRQARRDTAILSFLLDTGARASECCDLRKGDLDLPGRRCTIVGKGNKRRTLFLGRDCARDLYFYLRTRAMTDESPVFASERGPTSQDALRPNGLLQLFHRLGKAAGLRGVRCSPHTCRHTFAVSFLRGGGSEFALREILGHESLAMTARYVALARADIAAQHRTASPVDALRRRR